MSTDPENGSSAASDIGGRPDERFPQPAVARAIEGRQVLVSVVATVNLTRNQGKIRFVNPIPSGGPSRIEKDSQVVLRVKGGEGQLIGEYPVLVKLYSELSRDSDREGLADARLLLDADARAIELLIARHVADAVRIGGALPALRGAQRFGTDDAKELSIGLALDGMMEESHTYSVQVTTDHGRTWRTVAVGLREPVVSIDRRQFREGDELQVRITVTNGLSSSTLTTETFRV